MGAEVRQTLEQRTESRKEIQLFQLLGVKAVEAKGQAHVKLRGGMQPPGHQGPCDRSPGSEAAHERPWGQEENRVHVT